MSSRGYVMTGAGLICAQVAAELKTSALEIGTAMVQVHNIAFQQEAAAAQKRCGNQITQLDKEWTQLLSKRAAKMRPAMQQAEKALHGVDGAAKSVAAAESSVKARSAASQANNLRQIRAAAATVAVLQQAAQTLKAAPAPVSSNLQAALSCRAGAVAQTASAVQKAASTIARSATSQQMAPPRQDLKKLRASANEAKKAASRYQREARNAEALASQTAQHLMIARVGIVALQHSVLPVEARTLAQKAAKMPLQDLDDALRSEQQALAAGKVGTQQKSRAVQLHNTVLSAQKAALRYVNQQAVRVQKQFAKGPGETFKVDTSGGIEVIRPSVPAGVQATRQASTKRGLLGSKDTRNKNKVR